MFTIYKKIISPDTSPVLGPAKSESPELKPVQDQEVTQEMDSFSLSLCDCCSSRVKGLNALAPAPGAAPGPQSSYEFGHATHYTYNKTTPRLWHEVYNS
jgi:hypothetical protein